MTRARHDPAYLASKMARETYPHRPATQDHYARGFMAGLGDPAAEAALTGSNAELAGESAARGISGVVASNDIERMRQIVALRLASPHRARVGAVIAPQADAGHLPLFVAANEPGLF